MFILFLFYQENFDIIHVHEMAYLFLWCWESTASIELS